MRQKIHVNLILPVFIISPRISLAACKASLDQQMKFVINSSFFQLQKVAQIKALHSNQDMEMVIRAFSSSQLDYCNSLDIALNKSALDHIKLVQNSVARLLIGTKKMDHITPDLTSLH